MNALPAPQPLPPPPRLPPAQAPRPLASGGLTWRGRAQVDGANDGLKTNNTRLKEMVTKLRSSRNFCVDVVLLCILLGIGAYIYSLVK